MRRLVFIDDDKTELDDFGRIVEGEYDYAKIHLPFEAEKLFSGTAPDIFVSDLYLPRQSELLAREKCIAFADKRGQTHLYPRDALTTPAPLPTALLLEGPVAPARSSRFSFGERHSQRPSRFGEVTS